MDGNRHVHHQVHSLTKKPLGVSQVATKGSGNRLDPFVITLSLNSSQKQSSLDTVVRARERQPWQTLVKTAQDRRNSVG